MISLHKMKLMEFESSSWKQRCMLESCCSTYILLPVYSTSSPLFTVVLVFNSLWNVNRKWRLLRKLLTGKISMSSYTIRKVRIHLFRPMGIRRMIFHPNNYWENVYLWYCLFCAYLLAGYVCLGNIHLLHCYSMNVCLQNTSV